MTDRPKLVSLDRPETPQALRDGMIKVIKEMLGLAESGEIDSIILIPIKPSREFQTITAGTLPHLHAAGYISQALHDLHQAVREK